MSLLIWRVGRHFLVLAVMMLVLASNNKPTLAQRIRNRLHHNKTTANA